MFLLLSPTLSSTASTLSISISLIAACNRRFLFDLPIVCLSFSIFLACSRGSSVDRVSSMRTERPGVGRQLLRRPTKASTTTTITTDTGAAAPAVPAPPSPLRHHHHHHPGLAIAEQFLVFSSEGLPFSKCAAALRVRPIFLCEIRKEPEPAVKKRISDRRCASKSASRMHDDPENCSRKPNAIFCHAIHPSDWLTTGELSRYFLLLVVIELRLRSIVIQRTI